MAIARVKTWTAGEVLTANDLNNEFNNLANNSVVEPFVATQPMDLNGQILILDVDGDTLIDPSVNNTIDVTINGDDDFRFTPNLFTALNGSSVLIINGTLTVQTGTVAFVNGTTTLTNHALWMAQSTAIPSAATTEIWTTDGNAIHITGVVGITSLGTAPQAGAGKWVIFDNALTLTPGANLTLPGGVAITTAAGDAMFVLANTTTQHNVVSYVRANGVPLGPSTAAQGGSLVLIETLNLASDTIVNDLGSTYDEHWLHLLNVVPGTNNNDLLLTMSIDNGANFVAADYEWSLNGTVASSSASAIKLFAATSNTVAFGGVSGWVKVVKPYETGVHKRVAFDLVGANQTVVVDSRGAGRSQQTAPIASVANAVNAVKIAFNSGTISGTLRHYGIKNL